MLYPHNRSHQQRAMFVMQVGGGGGDGGGLISLKLQAQFSLQPMWWEC